MHKRMANVSASQAPMIDVVSVKPMGGFRLRIAFSDGSVGLHDFSSTAARNGEMVKPLKDPVFFARVFVELGALTWPNGFDLDPIALHERMAAAGELTRSAVEWPGKEMRQRYKSLSGRSGVSEYEIGPTFIRVWFGDRGYEYDEVAPGKQHVEEMKRLALSGDGLATYISKHVQENYAREV